MKNMGDKVKMQIGLQEDSSMWNLFDEYFDHVLLSAPNSKLALIVHHTLAGVQHFIQHGDHEQAVHLMKIGEDMQDLRQNEYFFVLSKVYGELRHQLYVRF